MSVLLAIAQLETFVQHCTDSDVLFGLEDECQELAFAAEEQMIQFEDEDPDEETGSEELVQQIRQAIQNSKDVAECEKAHATLSVLSTRVVQKMAELGPPK